MFHRDIQTKIRGVWLADETLSRVFDRKHVLCFYRVNRNTSGSLVGSISADFSSPVSFPEQRLVIEPREMLWKHEPQPLFSIQSSSSFCAGVPFSPDPIRALNDGIKIRENRGL